jgi:hypothetical protein
MMNEMKITDTQVADLVKSEKPWNVARRAFAYHAAKISARDDLSPLELRRMELRAVADIAFVFGTLLVPEPVPDVAPKLDPGPSPWAESPSGTAPESAPATGGRDPSRNTP